MSVCIIACHFCQKTVPSKPLKNGTARLPKAWKRLLSLEPVCSSCWKSRYVLRSVHIPVSEPIGATKDEMWDALRAGWYAATAAANLAVRFLLQSDIVRTPEMEKLPPMPRVYLYGELKGKTKVDPVSLTCLIHRVEQRYLKRRKQVVWAMKEAPPVYRDEPIYLHPRNWCCTVGKHGTSILKCQFGGRKWTLRLRSGKEFFRATKAFRSFGSGEYMPVEARIAQHGQCAMLTLCGWLPRHSKERQGTMNVTTGGDRFLCAIPGGRDPWILNSDHVRQWIAEHLKYLQRAAEDLKYEKRYPKHTTREEYLRHVAERCQKQRNRIDNFIGSASKMLAAFADRCGVSSVTYDDTDKSYFPSFPWEAFKNKLAYKLDELGIELICEVLSLSDTNRHEHGTEEETDSSGSFRATARPHAKPDGSPCAPSRLRDAG